MLPSGSIVKRPSDPETMLKADGWLFPMSASVTRIGSPGGLTYKTHTEICIFNNVVSTKIGKQINENAR